MLSAYSWEQLKADTFEVWKLFFYTHLPLYIQTTLVFMGFLSRTFTIHRTASEGGGIYLPLLYHFHPHRRHLDISWAIITESPPLHIASC